MPVHLPVTGRWFDWRVADNIASWASATESLAVGQVSLGPSATTFDLYPPQVNGCPVDSTDSVQYPLRIRYNYDRLPADFFNQSSGAGLQRWQALLPPLAPGLSMGEGGTPLLADQQLASWAGYDGELYIKTESSNPTGSHKDRLNLCTVSAAQACGAEGVLVASSGNHAISVAGYAARAGLFCIALTSESLATASEAWLHGYGATVVKVPTSFKWPALRQLQTATGFHPVSNLTDSHTGNPHGPEGYKTVAYELVAELGRAPGSVFVPTGYGEMLYGIHRGFTELMRAGVISILPRLYSCEPQARGPLARAIAGGVPVMEVDAAPTVAVGIACRVNGYRGVEAINESAGQALLVSDDEMTSAADQLARRGLWQETSCGASLAGLRQVASDNAIDNAADGPAVCIVASQGVKLVGRREHATSPHAATWDELTWVLNDHYSLEL